MDNTKNPFGTSGTGYDVGSYGQSASLDNPPGDTGSGGGRGSSSGTGTPPPDIFPAPPAIPQFSYTLLASRRVNFLNASLNAVRYEWTFYLKETQYIMGQSTQENPIFFYPYTGTEIQAYNVRLRAYNRDGAFIDIVGKVEVENLVPNCDFTYIVSGTLVRFTDISTNIDSDSPHWAFGDLEGANEINPHHIYAANGTYKVTLNNGSFNRTQYIVIDTEVVLICDPVSLADGYKWERSPNGVDGWVEFADTVYESVGVTEAVHGIASTVLTRSCPIPMAHPVSTARSAKR